MKVVVFDWAGRLKSPGAVNELVTRVRGSFPFSYENTLILAHQSTRCFFPYGREIMYARTDLGEQTACFIFPVEEPELCFITGEGADTQVLHVRHNKALALAKAAEQRELTPETCFF